MTYGKTLDGAYDIEADTLTVNESSDLKGFTTVDGPSRFKQDMDLQNPLTDSKITISASSALEDYVLKLPPIQGTAGQFFTTDGLGNSSWSSVTPTVGGVSYIALVGVEGFIKVNNMSSDSTFTNKTFNLELSGPLSTAFGGTGLTAPGTANQILSSTGSSLAWIDKLGYASVQFNINANTLFHRVAGPFIYTSEGLEIKFRKTASIFGIQFNKLYVNADGELDINLQDLIYPGKGLKKSPLLDEIGDLGLGAIGTGDLFPDLTVLRTDIDTEVLDFKDNKISIKSQSQSRIPYFNAFTIISDPSFLYNDAGKELTVNRITVKDDIIASSGDYRLTTKKYVDDFNYVAVDSALVTEEDAEGNRAWSIKLAQNYLAVNDDNELITLIKGVEDKCIAVTANNEIELEVEPKHFTNANSKLSSKLSAASAGCISLTPDYVLEFGFNDTHFSVVNNKLTSILQAKEGSCVQLDANYDLFLNFNDEHFNNTSGELNVILTAAGAITLSDSREISVSVNTTYLQISSNQITFATSVITKIDKIDNIESELNSTKSKVTTLEGKMTTVEGKVTTLEGKTTALEGRMTTAESTLTTHSTTLTTHTGQITALQGQIGAAIGAGVGGGIVGAVGGAVGGVLGGAGSAASGLGSAALAGLAGAGGALVGLGTGVLITQALDPDENGNPVFEYEIEKYLSKNAVVIADNLQNLKSLSYGTENQVLTSGVINTTPVISMSPNSLTGITIFEEDVGEYLLGSIVLFQGFSPPEINGARLVNGITSTGFSVLGALPTATVLGSVANLEMPTWQDQNIGMRGF